MADRAELLSEYAAGPALLADLLAELPPALWTFRPGPDRWCVHEIVVHLADAEVQSHVRLRMMLAEPGSLMPNHDEHRWSVELDYLAQDRDESLALIALLREINVRLLRQLAPEAWSRSAQHSVRGAVDVDGWLVTYAGHLPAHCEQIRRNRTAWLALAPI